MWRYGKFLACSTLVLRHHLYKITRAKHDQSSFTLFDDGYALALGNSEANAQLFLNGTSFIHLTSRQPLQEIQQLKLFNNFGILSSDIITTNPFVVTTAERTFIGRLLRDDTSTVNFSTSPIPTTADPSELGGSAESGDLEQPEELLDYGYNFSALISDMATNKHRKSGGVRMVFGNTVVAESINTGSSVTTRVKEYPSSSEINLPVRFDPDAHRLAKASAEEIITAVYNQDLPLLRSILTEKSWPDQRSIGHHLDSLFELVIRDSYDTDEAILFFQDFAASNRRNFLHDVNGIRLACRVARDTGSVIAAIGILRIFRNMFLVRAPVSAKSPFFASVLEQFYATLCSVGSADEVEELHKIMIDHGFDSSSDIFIRVLLRLMLKEREFSRVFDEWRRMSVKYGTTSSSEIIWEGLLTLVEDRKKQACFAGRVLSHCLQFDHPFAVVANFLVTLIRMQEIEAARVVFNKVSVPGKFFKKPLRSQVYNESSSQIIEDFASLITDCMLAENRETRKSSSTRISQSSFLSPELLLVLDLFYGVGRKSKQLKLPIKNEKRKLHRINDEQLFDLLEFVQSLWLDKSERKRDNRAVDRLIAWSVANRIEIPPKLSKRIAQFKSQTSLSIPAS